MISTKAFSARKETLDEIIIPVYVIKGITIPKAREGTREGMVHNIDEHTKVV